MAENLIHELSAKTALLDKAITQLGIRGRTYAEAEYKYRIALSKRILEHRTDGMPVTISSMHRSKGSGAVHSILQKDERCFICGSYDWIETHHIYGGNPNRRISEENGFKVCLCHWCHNEPPHGVHHNRHTDLWLKKLCQETYERHHTREEFIALIGKNYL